MQGTGLILALFFNDFINIDQHANMEHLKYVKHLFLFFRQRVFALIANSIFFLAIQTILHQVKIALFFYNILFTLSANSYRLYLHC